MSDDREILNAGDVDELIDWSAVEWTRENAQAFFQRTPCDDDDCSHCHSHFEEQRAIAFGNLSDLQTGDGDADQAGEDLESLEEVLRTIFAATQAYITQPIPMILFCPVCHRQHVDVDDDTGVEGGRLANARGHQDGHQPRTPREETGALPVHLRGGAVDCLWRSGPATEDAISIPLRVPATEIHSTNEGMPSVQMRITDDGVLSGSRHGQSSIVVQEVPHGGEPRGAKAERAGEGGETEGRTAERDSIQRACAPEVRAGAGRVPSTTEELWGQVRDLRPARAAGATLGSESRPLPQDEEDSWRGLLPLQLDARLREGQSGDSREGCGLPARCDGGVAHRCLGCGHLFRPANVHTVGVKELLEVAA